MKTINKVFLAAILVFLTLNFLDFLSTAIGIMSGKAYEANPIVNWMGGPFAPIAIIYKLAITPLMLLLISYLLINKYKNSPLAITLMGMISGILGFVVINNVKILFARAEICPKCGSKLSKEHKCLSCGLEK